MYPFGNFFPFNKISTETTLVNNGNINRQYFLDIAASAQEKANSNADQLQSEYSNLASRLKAFVSQMDSKYGTSWDGRQVLNAYFEAVKPREGTIGTKNDVWIDQIFNGSKSLYSLDYDEVKNFFFGMSIEMNYVQPKGGMTGVENRYPMKFEFAGDDDVWVYIDGIMFLNLSGIHRHVAGTIDFMEGKVYYYAFDSYAEGVIGATTKKDKGEPEATVTFEEILTETLGAEEAHKLLKYENGRYTTFKDYSAHNFKFYYMERGAGSSVCRINFNFPVIPKNSLAVSKTLDTENIPNNALGNPDFSFQVLKALENGTKTEELFITEGAEYKVYRNGQDTGERRRTGKDGVFALKAGEMAVFTEISADEGKYYVRERLESRVSDQYETDIEVGGTTKVEDENGTEIGETDFIGIDSPVQNIDDGALTLFNFTNKITGRLGTLEITKRIREEGSDYADLNQDFKFEIKLDKEPLKAGIEYTVTDEAGAERKASVEEGGIVSLKAGETVKIENILAGTEYTVQETAASSKGYLVTYDAADDQVTVETADGISYVKGKIKANTEGNTPVQITVTNSTGGTAIEIPGIKKLSNNDGKEHRYQFELEQVKDGTGTSFEPKVSAGTAVVTFNEGSGAESDGSTTDSSDKNSSFAFHLNYSAKEVEEGESVFYYKVSEVETEDTAAVTTKYDGREYLVEVKVTKKSENGSIVMEAKIVGYYLLTRTESGTITQTPVNSVEFENELVTDLTIAKDANGKVEKDKEFTFEVKIETGAEALLNGEFTAHRKGGEDSETEEFTVTFQNGLTEVKLKPGQVLTIKDLPYGAKWTVEEKDAEEYEVSYMINSKAEKLSAESRLSEKYVELPEGFRKGSKAEGNLTKDTNVITFINQIAYEKLTIAKYADDLVSEETEFLFRVVVKVEDMNGLFVPYTGDCIVTKSGEESPQTATFTEGQIEVSLKKNQSLTIDKLPHGATWSISEEGTGYYVYHIVDSSKVMDSLSEALEVIRDGSVETKGAFAEGDFKDENNQQEQVYVTFVNQVSFELPETGGHGTILYTLAGIGLTLTGCLLYRKKFRERRV